MKSVYPMNGIGLRQPHYREFRASRPLLGFVEVHSENFFNPHDAAAQVLAAVRQDYAVSLHGVGLALGSACGVDDAHVDQLAALVARIDPVRVSDHACFARAPWSQRGIVHANDLLPIAFTCNSLDILCSNVERVQERIGRPLLVENLSAYLDFAERDFSEPQFFAELGRRTGCGLLLDVNNLMVNALNADDADPLQSVCNWIDELAGVAAPGLVGEIHLAGFSKQEGLIIDDHSSPVSEPVWQAYRHALKRLGPLPTLIEWDEHLPAFSVLLDEATKAEALCVAQYAEQAAVAGVAA
ncbi:MAG: DUF692 domain-containing protein [Hydrogenophilales bacterium]|nr:DUF692 domain-containing protein [Hydrogenophilales bacterium]